MSTHNLFTFSKLLLAFNGVKASKSFNFDYLRFHNNLGENLLYLKNELQYMKYRPSSSNKFVIHDPKKRIINSFKIKDLLVQRILIQKYDKNFLKVFHPKSYGGIEGKENRKAIACLRKMTKNEIYFLKCDVEKFYDSINHKILEKQLKRIVRDDIHFSFFKKFIEMKNEKGIEVGSLFSQYFANLYLTPLDNYVTCYLKYSKYVRYMDDFILLSKNPQRLKSDLSAIKTFLKEKLDLDLSENVQFINSIDHGIDFLGFRVFRNIVKVRRKSLVRISRKIKNNEKLFRPNKISMEQLANKNLSLTNHLKTGDTFKLRKCIF